jgi:hypothetical protein
LRSRVKPVAHRLHELVVLVDLADAALENVKVVAVISLLDDGVTRLELLGEHGVQNDLVLLLVERLEQDVLDHHAADALALLCRLGVHHALELPSTATSHTEQEVRLTSDRTSPTYRPAGQEERQHTNLNGSMVSADTEVRRPLAMILGGGALAAISPTASPPSSSSSLSLSSEWSAHGSKSNKRKALGQLSLLSAVGAELQLAYIGHEARPPGYPP